MKFREMRQGRVFVVRLEDGDRIPDALEKFAVKKGIQRALVFALGGVAGGCIVVGPEKADTEGGVTPMLHELEGVHEAAALGTIFPTEEGKPELHLHAALGRAGETRTGCGRTGLEVWKVLEVVVMELLGDGPVRRYDPETGFVLLEP